MKNLFSFLFSRQMLAFVALLVIGAVIWFVGPLFAFGGLRPLETVTMRATVIVMLLVLLLALLLYVPMHVVGIAALCLSIWHGGPLLTIATAQPLAPVSVRTITIAVILLIYAGYWLYRLREALSDNKNILDPVLRKKKDGDKSGEKVAQQEIKAMQGIVARALTQLKAMRTGAGSLRRLLEGKRYLYDLPWYMVIGKPGTGKTSAVVNSGLKFPLAAQKAAASDSLALAGQGGTAHCDWWLTREAVLIDTAGRYATHDIAAAADQAEWRSFLALLRKHRTRAPINGAIVALNIADVLMQTDAGRLAYVAQLRERLVELRTGLGIRFPVYVMVTKMDMLEGFNEYFQSMTSEGRAQVWGFTLPYTQSKAAVTDDQPTLEQQVHAELNGLAQRIETGVAGRLQEVFDKDLRRALFALPQEFAGLMPTLMKLLNELFDDARFDGTEVRNSLRGLYFTSAAQGEINIPANSMTLLQRLRSAIVDKSAATMDSHRKALLKKLPASTTSYFLYDLFTKVIIPEAHLVRPNLRWERRFRLLRLCGHALAMVIFLWLTGGALVSFDNNKDYLDAVSEKTADLQHRVSALFAASGSDIMLMVPDALSAAQELPLYRGLDPDHPSGAFRYGLYSASPVLDAARSTYTHLQESLLLPEIIRRMEEVLRTAISSKDTGTAYETLRVYLQLHGKNDYNADDVKAWVQNDWTSSDSAMAFGSPSAISHHVNQLFSGKRAVQSSFTPNAMLVGQAREFLGSKPATQRLYERAKSAMEQQAPQEFALTRAVGPQAGTVFTRASGQPLDKGVPGMFTYDGYHDLFSKRLPEMVKHAQMEDARVMGNADSGKLASAQKKTFVLANAVPDDDPVTQDIRRRYLEDYAQHWEDFLTDIRTVTGSSLSFDLTMLRAFASPDSPLSRLARAAARETTLSRPLVVMRDGDKNLLDRASDAVRKKSRDVLGVSPQQQLEKNVVDKRFAALREVVTGQADAGQAQEGLAAARPGLENVSASLNAYYTLLVVADTALNAGSLPPGTLDAGTKLKLEGDKLPAPFKQIMTTLADSGTQKIADGMAAILRRQAQQQVDRINSMLAYQVTDICKRGIEGRYPFAAHAAQEVSADDFTRVFAAGGAADDFFQQQLAPFVDMSARPWRYKSPTLMNPMSPAEAMATGLGMPGQDAHPAAVANTNVPTLLGELLKLLAQQGPNPDSFARMQTIREAFFREPGGKTASWMIDLKVTELDPTILELIMDFDGQVQRYAHGPVQALTVNWPGPRKGTSAELSATPRIRPDTSSIIASGPWALLRLLERGKLTGSFVNSGRAVAEFQFDGRKAMLEMNTGTFPNPLTSDVFKGFSCPGSRI